MKILNSKKNKDFLLKRTTDLSISYSVRMDWVILISSLCLFFVLTILIATNIYYSVVKESKVSNEEETVETTQKINTEQLERVVSEFNNRKEKFESF